MKNFYIFCSLVLMLSLNIELFSQHRNCGTMEYLEYEEEQDPQRALRLKKIDLHTNEAINNPNRVVEGVITIPCVVHVIFNNSTENISDAQVLSQIEILTEDFRRLNPDASNTPSVFQGVAADSEFEFCLATVDPNGNSTTGITRTFTTRTSFGSNNQMKFNSSGGHNAWPTGDYLNIWVCDLSGGLLGYAQFPGGNPATDGIVCDYLFFGDTGVATPPFDLGRTATHEVGHWLNLRHIWGDGGCGVDDFVGDTPLAGSSNFTGLPCNFPGPNSCNTGSNDQPDMFQNYMDYSDDACMNLFTVGQKNRMRALFEPGGFRESLLSSTACGVVSPPSCMDGIQNGSETGVDCGGSCPPCISCNDGIQNGTETGVDCGGSCPPCISCNDGIQNGTETGIDCGGSCPPCFTCNDGIQNGNETGIDCGGSCPPCPPDCPDNVQLNIVLDLFGSHTTWIIEDNNGLIHSGGPYPQWQNGLAITESLCLEDGCYTFTIFDVAGNGICCLYGQGSYTLVNLDEGVFIASGGSFGSSESTEFCINDDGEVEPTCTDGIQNGDEEGVDCGGSFCTPCITPPTCTDGIQNGDEEGVDCGGSFCTPCVNPPTCTDGIQNGDEAGIDCGGTFCPPCSSECGPPTGDYVEYTNNPSQIIIHWNPVPDATKYQLRFRQVGAALWFNAVTFTNFRTLNFIIAGATYEYQIRSFCPNGWSDYSPVGTFTANASRESDELTFVEGIELFPNPVNEKLNIQLEMKQNGPVEIIVIDLLGRKVITQSSWLEQGFHLLELNVSILEDGYHLLQIEKEGEKVIKKFVKN